ncbi:MAG: RtcB family protein [Gemmatimonadetes bacterium]|nr:RtcB family protein [Gemmatimonadota bacterium]
MRVFGTHDEHTLAQLRAVAKRAVTVALMADGHRGYVMPIGGVAAYDGRVSPIGVGVDIACGNAAIRTDLTAEEIRPHLDELADEIAATIGFGLDRPQNTAADAPVGHPLFESSAWDAVPDARTREELRARARTQLGTVGGGNHYVDVFADEEGRVWVGVHFGSRGLGFISAHGYVALAQGQEWKGLQPQRLADMNREVLLDLGTPLGDAYWSLMTLAGEYAYAGREWVARKVVGILGGSEIELVHNHHNFAWKEPHGGRELVVVRKGATPAFPGQRGFVGGSMGDPSVILRGAAETDTAASALFSTVHGAGRVMGRMQAKGKWKRGRLIRPGRITHDDWADWLDRVGVVLRGGDLDEAPQAYRRLGDVLTAQGDTIVIEHTLDPLIVVMAPARTGRP